MAEKLRSKPIQRLSDLTQDLPQCPPKENHRTSSEFHERSQKKIEFSKQVIEVGDGTVKMRSLNGTPSRTREKSKTLIENSSFKEAPDKKQGSDKSPFGRTDGKRNASTDKVSKERDLSKSKNGKDLKKPKNKAGKSEIKIIRPKKLLEETQSPVYIKPKKFLVETCQLKSTKSEGNKVKFIEKPKLKSAKVVNSKCFTENIPKKTQNNNLFSLENTKKTVVLKSLLKPSKIAEISTYSSHSESEPGDWIDLNIGQYKGKTSEFVGEFIEKFNGQKIQLNSQVKAKLDSRVSVEHSTSNFSQSTAEMPASKMVSKGSEKLLKKNDSTRSNQGEKINLKEISLRTQENKKLSQSSRGDTNKKH